MTKNNSGDWNSGDWNSGHKNSGNWNSGNWNSGDWNSGDCNSGHWNSGNNNSGHKNSGDWNSGNNNSGDCNSGHWNSGNCNSGHWNSGNNNSGYLNIDTPNIRIFGKESSVSQNDLIFPSFFYFELTTWVSDEDMSDKEKEVFPSYVTTGGYLKTREYKQAFIESYEKATPEDRALVEKLPNFDADIFFQISGIRIGKMDKVRCEIDGKEFFLSRDSVDSLKKSLNNK